MKYVSLLGLKFIIFGLTGFYHVFFCSTAESQRPPAEYTDRIAPVGSLANVETSLRKEKGKYLFTALQTPREGETRTIVYQFDPEDRKNASGFLKIKAILDSHSFFPLHSAAPLYRLKDMKSLFRLGSKRLVQSRLISHSVSGDSLILSYKDTFPDGIKRQRKTIITLIGKSLKLQIDALNTERSTVPGAYNYAGFDLGSPVSGSLRRVSIPYMPNAPVAVSGGKAFSSAFFDLTQSSASVFMKPKQTFFTVPVQYNQVNANEVMSLHETGYVTVSQLVQDTFPNPNNHSSVDRDEPVRRMFLLENSLEARAAPFETSREQDEQKYRLAEYCAAAPPLPSPDNPSAEMPVRLDGQAFNQYRFNNISVYLSLLGHFGIRDIVYGSFRFGGDYSPRHLPICSRWGGEAEYKKILQTAETQGQVFIDHQIWHRMAGKFILDPKSPDFQSLYYRYAAKNRREQLTPYGPQKFPAETAAESTDTPFNYATAAEGLIPLAQEVIPYLADTIGLQGTFLDTLPGWYPGRILKLNFAQESGNRTLAMSIYHQKRFFDYMKAHFAGPIVGEGGKGYERFDSFYAGYIDGVEREHDQHREAMILPNYELKYIKPKSALNFGMGWHSRWQCQGSAGAEDNSEFGGTCRADEFCTAGCMSRFDRFDFDRYRAQVISFGHAHMLPSSMDLDPKDPADFHKLLRRIVKEYYLMNALQKNYLHVDTGDISYFLDKTGEYRNLSQILLKKAGYDFNTSRIRVQYENGLTVYVNNSNSPDTGNWTVSDDVREYVLPPNGFLAYNPGKPGFRNNENFKAFSALVNGQKMNYVSSDEYLMSEADGSIKITTLEGKIIECDTARCTAE